MRYTDVIFKKGAALLLAFILLLPSAAIADEAAMDGMVRVYLSSLGNRTRVDLTVCGSYSLDGTPSGNARCRQAVEETRGIVAMNGGAFTATYYTASNGGQIESARNAWGYSGYDYIRVKDDRAGVWRKMIQGHLWLGYRLCQKTVPGLCAARAKRLDAPACAGGCRGDSAAVCAAK